MPTYDYCCKECGREDSVVQTISQYSAAPIRPQCHGHDMERKLSVVPTSALSFALAGDRHYENLRGPNGEDLSSRTKHREFMKQSGLTTMDDFKSTFKKAEEERTALRNATFQDKELRKEITQQVMTAVAQPD